MRGMNRKSLAVVLVGSLSVAGVSLAKGPGGGRFMRDPEMVLKFDANKNGQLEDSEREAMRAEMKKLRAEKLAKYDTNKDGELDENERKALRDEFAAERFKALDKNGNGTLSLEEFKAGMAERIHGGPHGRR
jgi:hypothetical protein